ncbi:MAG: 5-formyltetrahydrofolate cyclo-ligase [Egibacteraceae bacterium]
MKGVKTALRTQMLAARAQLSEAQRAQASTAIRQRLERLPELRTARTLLCYAAFGAEVDLDPWLERLLDSGIGVFLPWVDGERLSIARINDVRADLVPGWRGVREPRAIGRRPARLDRLQAVVTPGVAFDRSGGRLGYGGGHFDRLLADLSGRAPVVGVAFELQMVETLPTAPHDRPVDVVVTEHTVYRGGHDE